MKKMIYPLQLFTKQVMTGFICMQKKRQRNIQYGKNSFHSMIIFLDIIEELSGLENMLLQKRDCHLIDLLDFFSIHYLKPEHYIVFFRQLISHNGNLFKTSVCPKIKLSHF